MRYLLIFHENKNRSKLCNHSLLHSVNLKQITFVVKMFVMISWTCVANLHANIKSNMAAIVNKVCYPLHLSSLQEFELDVLEEAYTTEHWLVRIYKVKDLENRGL